MTGASTSPSHDPRVGWERRGPSSHSIVSLCFSVLIAAGFAYVYWFQPSQHPVTCAVLQMTGRPCTGCGLTRAFALFSHFNFEEGRRYNDRALPLFMFFSFQFIARTTLFAREWFFAKALSRRGVVVDAGLAVLSFATAFYPFMRIGP